MTWIFIIIGVYILGFVLFIVFEGSDHAETEREKEMYDKLEKIVTVIIQIIAGIILLAIVGFIWYFLCGGGIIIECEESIGGKIIGSILSLIPLVTVLGVLVKLFNK